MSYLLYALVVVVLIGAFGIALLVYSAGLSEDDTPSPGEPL